MYCEYHVEYIDKKDKSFRLGFILINFWVPLGSTAWISSVALQGWLAPSRFRARTLQEYHWPSIRPVTWHFSSGTTSPQGSHLSVPLWQRSRLQPRMLEPPSYLGGSQVRKMLLADLSLHLRFSGGSGMAEGRDRGVRKFLRKLKDTTSFTDTPAVTSCCC